MDLEKYKAQVGKFIKETRRQGASKSAGD